MYALKLRNYQRVLSQNYVPASEDNLNTAYKTLCNLEGIKEGKAFFFNPEDHTGKEFENFNKGRYLLYVKNFIFFAVNRRRLYIEKSENWLLYLFHEFAHQILMDEQKESGHGIMFEKIHMLLLDCYFIPFVQNFSVLIQKN